MMVDAAQPAEIADQFRATILWMQDAEMLPEGAIYSEMRRQVIR